MRTSPSGAYTTAVGAAGVGASRPDVRLEILDTRQHYALLGGPSANTGRNAALLSQGTDVIQAYCDMGVPGKIYRRRTLAAAILTGASWTAAYTLVDSNAFAFAGVALALLSDRIRLYWQDATTFAVRYSESLDDGATWSAAATTFTPGAPCRGLAGDSGVAVAASLVFVVYDVAGPAQRVAVVWAGLGAVDWTNGDAYQIVGIAALRDVGGVYRVAVAVQRVAGGPTLLQTCTYTPGVGWSGLAEVAGVDTSTGITLGYPQLSFVNSQVALTFETTDVGTYTGLPSKGVARLTTGDYTHWGDAAVDSHTFAWGACWLQHPVAGYLLLSGDTPLRAPIYYAGTPTMFYDATGDVLHVERAQRDGHPAMLSVTLDNSAGTYALGTGLTPLGRNVAVRLSEGYVLPGGSPGDAANLLYTGVFYVDDWTYHRTADTSTVVVVARDLAKRLERQSRDALAYANVSLAYLAQEMATRGGAGSPVIPSSTPQAQFPEVIAAYQLAAGHTWSQGMSRLGTLMGFSWCAQVVVVGTLLPGGGVAGAGQAGTDQLLLKEKAAGEASVWSYGVEMAGLTIDEDDLRANHVLAYGKVVVTTPGTAPRTAYVGEAWDYANQAAVGEERYRHVVDRLLGSTAQAGKRAALELLGEQRAAVAGTVIVPGNPLLELWDVISLSDSKVSASSVLVRIAGLHQVYDRLRAINDLTLTLEGV